MLQLFNQSPFDAAISLFPNKKGVDSLYCIVKATFQIGDKISIADEQTPIMEKDEFFGDPASSSLKYPSEYHIAKKSTDIAMISHAWPSNQTPTHQVDVSLSVAECNKTIRVFGNRFWDNNQISHPENFDCLPIVYERAFGGSQLVENDGQQTIYIEERNPIGIGFLGPRPAEDMNGQPLPNIEDPNQLIQNIKDIVKPTGFTPIACHWQPRSGYAGTYDEQWQAKRAPYLPHDFDERFLNNAHPDLVFDRYLQGGEPVQITNANSNGPINFFLPICKFEHSIKIAGTTQTPLLNMETLLLEPNENRFSITWRSEIACDKQALKIESIVVDLMELHI